jgi:type I restriction enzyme M protein
VDHLFATSLKAQGRAALVMANSASDARHSEADIRKTLIEQNLIYAMLTLPSNMFYTVILPATLWFFDKAKTDDKILFIDARNIFTQIDRVHREFSEEHIQNIAIISQLHKGRREKFVQLIDRYFAAGMQRLVENKANVEPVSSQLLEVLDDAGGKQAVGELVQQWAGLAKLKTRYEKYLQQHSPVIPNTSTVIPSVCPSVIPNVCEESSAPYKISPSGRNDSSVIPNEREEPLARGKSSITVINKAQQQLREAFDPFFIALHEGLKYLDKVVHQHEKQEAEQAKAEGKRAATDRKTNALKGALVELHKEVKNAEIFYQHIHWLQERFPKAEYEDVTGLCKLASPVDLQEQDYSLNPGRYVGVVVEEDGKTEEDFISDMLSLGGELATLSAAYSKLEPVILNNLKVLVGEV